MRARNSGTRAASIVRPAACLWPPNRMKTSEQRSSAAEHVEVRDAAAGSVGHVAVDRQHDRRLVIRVDELRRRDADDAAVPAVAADDEHVVRADGGVGFNRLLRLRDEIGFFLLAAQVLVVQLLRQRARFIAMRLVGGEQQPRRDVGRAHPARGVHARRQHEADLVAVDGLAASARTRRAARAARPCAVRG